MANLNAARQAALEYLNSRAAFIPESSSLWKDAGSMYNAIQSGQQSSSLSKIAPILAGTAAGVGLLSTPSEAEGAPWYSKLGQAIENMPNKMDAEVFRRYAQKLGVSPKEIDHSFGDLDGVVNKLDLAETHKVNGLKLEDKVLGGATTDLGHALYDQNRNRYYVEYPGVPTRWFRDAREADNELDRLQGRTAESSNVKFDTWQLPGGKEGSYREMFVTAPGTAKTYTYESQGATIRLTGADENGRPYRIIQVGNRAVADDKQHRELTDAELLKLPMHEGNIKRLNREGKTDLDISGSWNDGHSQYSNIQNPVVRLRFNDREVDGKKILFLEEMQGPSDAEQSNMPEHLKKRIYDIGTKRAISYAKENGYDGIAWTPGQVQADRYDLSKQLTSVTAEPTGYGRFRIKAIDVDGAPHFDIGTYPPEELPGLIGKDLAKKIIDDGGGTYTGLDLQVGGEGLKHLYDQMIPSLMKKHGKEEVGKLNLSWPVSQEEFETGNFLGKDGQRPPVSYIPITEKTPSSFSPWMIGGLATGAALGAMGNTDEASAMPLGNVAKQSLKAATKMLDNPRSEDAAFNLIGKILNLKVGHSIDRQPLKVIDVRQNPHNDWRYLILKDREGNRFQYPMTKDYLHVLNGSVGTQKYLEQFNDLGQRGKNFQALKSLGIREEKRAFGSIDEDNESLFKQWNTSQAHKAVEIDPSLLNDYVYVRSTDNVDSPILYMPRPYADFLQTKGYLKIIADGPKKGTP